MVFPLPVGDKFACIALANAEVARSLHDPIELGQGFWAIFEPPFGLDEGWRGWLGSIQADKMAQSNFVLLSHAESQNPGLLDAENQQLSRHTLSLFYALFVVEVFHQDGGLAVGGANLDGTVTVRQVSQLENHYRPNGVISTALDRDALLRAAHIASGIRAVYVPRSPYNRLQRGFHAFIRAIQEYYGDERLHQFVRAVEAVVMPRIGRSKRDFVHRGQLFVGSSNEARGLLGDLFDLRSEGEHLHPRIEALERYPERNREAVALRRAYQAQVLAMHVYDRIFSSQDLQAAFSTDDEITSFWNKTPAEQLQLWGQALEINQLVGERFQEGLIST